MTELDSDVSTCAGGSPPFNPLAPPCPPPGAPGAPGKSIGGFLSGLLSNISIDDLILIGIGILLLLDGDEGNDAILILILALLFL